MVDAITDLQRLVACAKVFSRSLTPPPPTHLLPATAPEQKERFRGMEGRREGRGYEAEAIAGYAGRKSQRSETSRAEV